MRLAVIANRTLSRAAECFRIAGVEAPRAVTTRAALETCIRDGVPAVTEDPFLLCEAAGLDCLVDVTGAVEHGAQVTLAAIRHGRHVVTMNAELDGTVGPILKQLAD